MLCKDRCGIVPRRLMALVVLFLVLTFNLPFAFLLPFSSFFNNRWLRRTVLVEIH